MCLCEDLTDVGLLTVSGGAGGAGAVGVNGKVRMVNLSRFADSLIAHAGFSAVADAEVSGALSTAGDASWVGRLKVGDDLSVGGDARGLGLLQLGGALRVAGRTSLLGLSAAIARADYEPEEPPCPCDPSTFFDVQAAVEAGRDSNDNASIGLEAGLRQVGLSSLTLPSGSYYVSDPKSIGALTIEVTGKVALYVDGHLDSIGLERLRISPDAELDLYVSGGLRSVGLSANGSPEASSRLRIYVRGDAPVLLSVGAQAFYGAIYAPEAELAYVGATRIVGSLFARTLRGVGALSIEHGASGTLDPDDCDPSDPSDPSTPPGDGDSGAPVDITDGGAGEPEEPEEPEEPVEPAL
jgi:hypothetical protein